ncbi:MAG TPA: ribonuclease Y [Jatrophihabitans sp.]|nr:ribonuclease Y [Jatrophihabitans sp.]
MSQWINFAAIVAVFVLLLVLGFKFVRISGKKLEHSNLQTQAAVHAAESEADGIRERARRDAESIRRAADTEIESLRRAANTEAAATRAGAEAVQARAEARAADLLADAQRTIERENTIRTAQLDQLTAQLDERSAHIQRQEAMLAQQLHDLEAREERLQLAEAAVAASNASLERAQAGFAEERQRALERLAGLTAEDAKQELLAAVETAARRDAAALVRSVEAEARAESTERARAIVVEAVQRVASEQTTETVVSVLHLPGDEMKGRIIGREGRNIRAFESVTGVNVIIDDTPEAVLLSCFDPVRREIGRITLEKLVLDGRIHPHRIEEIYESAKVEVDELCLRSARDALAEVGIRDLDDRLLPTLGRLRYRTSYGQNVLGHLVETAHIAGIMAAELGLEPGLIKRSAFLHDIGKALTHEVEGSHALIGADLLRRHGESEAVAHAVEAHHNEVAPRTVEAVLTQAADACSAARPGARRESLESYVKRLERIEEIAAAKPGVERVFAMQAGREVRVMVQPNEVDDLAAGVIAREVAKQIEDELTYPGQIRVTVVRESRATEVAH